MDKAGFMEVLSKNGYIPVNEDGCIMIVTANKSDHDKMQELAEQCGYAGKGSYGWRRVKTIIKAEDSRSLKGAKPEAEPEPIYSDEEKARLLKKAKETDIYQLTFVEYIQNEEWYDDTKKVLKEYEKFLDDPENYGIKY